MGGAITQSRILSRGVGISSASTELEHLGFPIGHPSPMRFPEAIQRDAQRGRQFGENYAKQWLKKAEGDSVAAAAKVASNESLGSLARIGATESSQAFGDGRARAIDELKIYEGRPRGAAPARASSLLKVWDAELDKRTCPICGAADGTIVGIREKFPQGEPGTLHPFDRCTFSILTFEERGENGSIEPKAPAKIISLPVRPAASAAAPKP